MPTSAGSPGKNGRGTGLGYAIECVFMTSFCVKTTLAKIEIIALLAFEPGARDWTKATSVTGDSGMVAGN